MVGQYDADQKIKILGIDLVSAILAAGSVAPGIAIVDQAVTEYAAGESKSLFRGAFMNLKSVFLTPKVFFGKPTFMVVAGVYTGTYIAANFIMSWCEFSERNPEFYKLGGTTVVNMTLGILKDKYFAQKFSGKPVERFPLTSWSMFVMRDLFTIGAGFNLPRLMSSHLVEKNYVSTKKTGDFIAQFAAPMSAQFIITPMHLLSLDFYNNKISNASARFRSVASNYLDSTGLRMGRVICAYGLAGVFNNGLKQTLRDKYVGQPKL